MCVLFDAVMITVFGMLAMNSDLVFGCFSFVAAFLP